MGAVSLTVVEIVARAIFKRAPSLVTEIYSTPGETLQRFGSAEDLCSYAELLRQVKGGAVFVGVRYPDMDGDVTIREFELTKGPDRGKMRSSVAGWGLIHVFLPVNQDASCLASIYRMSERGAFARERGGIDLPPVRDWNWKAVESHSRRLKRVLKDAI
ncbi:hypothetical protein ACSYHF_12775 [Stenotrophomonas maltophilia group sp. P373]|uniref:hypothetical protein n=1 Tax=Stenotrophomonas maltophilia group TaxID=995085 RepID=UPI001267E647|nr:MULTISPECIES: hypothetical protein [Stenotrophomonas maltophilia group]MBH1588040.1 hypothetical protein [Stenotrophomonas maltophilia]